MTDKSKRDYKQERRTAKARGETGVGSDSGDAKRHRARRALEKKRGKKLGDKEAGHKKPIKSGGSNSTSNLKAQDAGTNKREGGKMGNRRGKAAGGAKSKRK